MVTGASTGIGRELSLQLLQHGHTVCAIARRASELEPPPGAPGRLHAFTADLADLGGIPALCTRILSEIGPPELLICNAGISQRAPAVSTEPQAVRQLVAVNLEAPLIMVAEFLRADTGPSKPQVVLVGSLASLVPAPLRTTYAAAKHGLRGFARSLRTEGHAVTEVYPGFVRTSIGQLALTGSGDSYGRDDPAQQTGADPASVARQILRATRRGRKVIRPALGASGRLALLLSWIAPAVLDRILHRRFLAESSGAGLGEDR